MKIHPSRRLFLRNTAIATTGVALLSSTTFANTLTSNNCPFDGYNPYAEEKTDLRTSSLFGKHLHVKGEIFDTTGTHKLSNATVEVWHLSPNSTKYKHRAKLKTNTFGEYHFITDFPNKEIGKGSRIYFKVSYKSATYFTELLVNDFGAYITSKHWEENNQLNSKLFPIKNSNINNSVITFNISI
ncbi:hypothetical protein BX611_1997 [Lutibacter oceani]|uniref:Intradiol ring-cleavage dioxygenases domain-containing protein n=1 Tax=Lutibacter oceani TaxID=1853311 RepID=A0A3D9RUI4_9FLAO|nr:hypothetical protein [Lutibacter oceani]REE80355.1 hypothetical protein BX611_1997 [Lutibacter oceani]